MRRSKSVLGKASFSLLLALLTMSLVWLFRARLGPEGKGSPVSGATASPPAPTTPAQEFRAGFLAVAEVRPLDPKEPFSFRAWAPDGKHILARRRAVRYNLATTSGEPLAVQISPTLTITIPAGEWVTLGDLWVISGAEKRQVADLAGEVAWSPEGEFIAYTTPLEAQGPRGGIYVVEMREAMNQGPPPEESHRPGVEPPLRLGKQVAEGDITGKLSWLPGGELVFLRGGYLHAVRPDGSGLRRLNDFHIGSPHYELRPGKYLISPDGERILCLLAIESPQGGNREWIMANLDGSDVRSLTRELAQKGLAVEEGAETYYDFDGWSPDGRRLAFRASIYRPIERTWRTELWVMDSDGSNPHPVFKPDKDFVAARSPTWSPDGQVIAFIISDPSLDPPERLAMVNWDGTGLRRFPLGWDFIEPLRWSPEGLQLAYGSHVVILTFEARP